MLRIACNFSHNENFVVFECIDCLLSKGYRPEHIELEKKWTIGHEQKRGKVDDYFGIKFTQKEPSGNLRVKTLGLHPAHNGHPIHWQLNNINPLTGGIGKKIRWDLLLRRLIG